MTMAVPPGAKVPRPLTQIFAQVTLDGSGNGTAQIGPQRVREHWQVSGVAVKTNPNPTNGGTNEATATAYMGGSLSDATFLDATFTGSTGDTCGCGNVDMQTGMQVFVRWTGGDPGALATFTVIGTYTIGSP